MTRLRSALTALLLPAGVASTAAGNDPLAFPANVHPHAMPGNSAPPPAPVPTDPAYDPTPAVRRIAPADPCAAPCPETCTVPCPPPCPTVFQRPQPTCGPRIRVVVPPPEITYRAAPTTQAGGCSESVGRTPCGGPSFGAAPSRPQPATTTVHVPYTYMMPVPTYAMMPQTGVAFGSAPTVGFGAVPTVAFGSTPVVGAGAVGTFGAVQPASLNVTAPGGVSFGASGASFGAGGIEAMLLQMALAALKGHLKDSGIGTGGATPAGDCRREIAELSARLDKLRDELVECRKSNEVTTAKLTDAIVAISATLDAHTKHIRALAENAEPKAGK